MAARRRPRSVCVQGFAARPGILRPWAAAALNLVFLALAGDEAPAQNGGCARCSAPALSLHSALPVPTVRLKTTALPVPTVRPKTTSVERTWRRERWTLRTSLEVSRRRGTQSERKMAAAYTVCVRTCDGSFFPISYTGAGSRADSLEEVCRALCPNAEAALYSFPFGGTIEEAVSASGEPYANLPNADKFEQAYDPNCSCRRQGESWAEALAAAEAKYGRHSSEIVVSVEAAERMSRPVQDPTAKPPVADPAQNRAAPPVGLPPGLDVNGVDTSLSAATAAISRESAGIRDGDSQRATSYGLKEGQPVEETIPDGSIRRVRVLPSTF
jgi:Protein of unknown function (DUF2865)